MDPNEGPQPAPQASAGDSGVIFDAIAYAAIALLRSRDVAAELPGVLRMLGESIGVSRVYIYQNFISDGQLADIQRFAWTAPGIGAAADEDSGNPYAPVYERYVRTLGIGDIIAELAADAPQGEQAWLKSDGTLSYALVPIFVGDGWWGYIGFDDCWSERRWTKPELGALRVAAETIGAAFERQERDSTLIEIERRYRTFIEQAPDIIIYADHPDEDDTTTYVSPQIEDILGVTPERWIEAEGGTLWLDMLHPEDRERVERQYEAYLDGGPDLDDYRMIREDGRVVWIRDRAKIVPDADGQPVEWGVFMDITRMREVEDRLHEAENKFQVLVEKLPAITYIYPVEGTAMPRYISPQIEAILGYSAEEWTADPVSWDTTVHPEDRELLTSTFEQADRTLEPYSLDYRVVASDGRTVWFHEEAHMVRNIEGQPLYWLGVILDISEAKEAEARSRETDRRFRTLFENGPAITVIVSAEEEVLHVSPQIEDVYGYPPEEFIRNPGLWNDVLHPDDRARIMDLDRSTDETGEPFVADYRIISASGETRWIHEESNFITGVADSGGYWLGTQLDISASKRAEGLERTLAVEKATNEKLRELDHLKDQFLAGVSHDLRTPLSSILGFALTLDQNFDDLSPEQQRNFLERITVNARKLNELVTDLLDVHRTNQGVLVLETGSVDIGLLVAEVVDQADYLAKHLVMVETESVFVQADAIKVKRIVENLLTNTARHTPPGTQVWVKVSAQPDGALISVEDAGPGIPTEEKARLFHEFTRGADGPRENWSPGLGVGLSLVARFAELHGGRAWVEDRPGGGSAFRVWLPKDLTAH